MERGDIGEVYNIGSGEERKNIEVAEHVLKLLGKPADLIEFTRDRLGHDFRYSLNSEKIKDNLGWKAKVTFNDGIEKTVRWYLDNMKWLKGKMEYLGKYWKKVYR